MDRTGEVHHELAKMIAQQGWIGVTISPEFDGMGAGHLAKTIILEELSAVSAAAGAIAQASQLGVSMILNYGTPEQKRRWLPAVAAGDCLPTIAVTEEGSGGNVLDMTTSAEADGDDHYILNGHKVWVGNSHVADLHGVVAKTGGQNSRGLSAFLVESTTPGLHVQPHHDSIALRGFSYGKLVFDNCRVPGCNMLGGKTDGLHAAYASSMLYGRPNLTAVALGIHRAVHDLTVEFCRTQRRKGRPC